LCFIGDKIQSTLKTSHHIKPNQNKTFPIGTIETVKHVFDELYLPAFLDDLKRCGHQLSSLVLGLVSYKLTEDLSVSRCHQWMNSNPSLLEFLNLDQFGNDALYRCLEKIGKNRHLILSHILNILKRHHGVGLDMVFLDWTSVHFEAMPSEILRYGYSRDHRPDRPQVTIGVAQDEQSKLPVGMSILPGNINDQTHFKTTYKQIKPYLRKGAVMVFDAGASGASNLDLLNGDRVKYLSRMKLNQSDVENHLQKFTTLDWTKIVTRNKKGRVYGKKLLFPSRTKYLYFSQDLHDEILLNRRQRLEQEYDEAIELRKTIALKKRPRRKYRNSNHFLHTHLSYTFPLTQISRKEAIDRALQLSMTGKEGFFALISNKDFSLHEALIFYREKDSIEKLFNSIKNEIRLRPTRCWTQEAIYGSILIVFLAQLVISMCRYKHAELRRVSTKFIMQSLKNFALTIIIGKNGRKKHVFSNFDWINTLIFCGKTPGT
jgi:transposase